jgi:hypothetical protein
MTNEVSKLDDLTARIRIAHSSVQHAMRNAVEYAMETGDLLLEAKEQIQHGQWGQWLQDNCQIADRTARLYMRLAKNRTEIEAQFPAAGMTLNAAAKLLASPKEDDDDAYQKETIEIIRPKYISIKTGYLDLIAHLKELKDRVGKEKFDVWFLEQFPIPTDLSPEQEKAQEVMDQIIDEMLTGEDVREWVMLVQKLTRQYFGAPGYG